MPGGAKQIALLVIGGLLVLLNKPLAESQRALHKELSGEKYQEYAVWNFRLPILFVGDLLLLIGILFFFP
jgi:hypothetical protein